MYRALEISFSIPVDQWLVRIYHKSVRIRTNGFQENCQIQAVIAK
jgi:hypothetical protein